MKIKKKVSFFSFVHARMHVYLYMCSNACGHVCGDAALTLVSTLFTDTGLTRTQSSLVWLG